MSNVAMLPGARGPDAALKWIPEALAEGAECIVVIAIGQGGGTIDPRIFGDCRRLDLAIAGAMLQHHAATGGDE